MTGWKPSPLTLGTAEVHSVVGEVGCTPREKAEGREPMCEDNLPLLSYLA